MLNRQQTHLFQEPDKAQEAVEFLREHLTGKGEIFVAFSGGKDSICTAKLMELSGLPYRLFYSFTGIDPPEAVRFIRREYPGTKFLRPTRSFWRNLSVNCPPSGNLRWCCHALKKEPGFKQPHFNRVHGIRAEESAKRAKYGRMNHYKAKWAEWMLYYPIYDWNEADIWDFIEQNELAYPSLYDEGFDRIGCVICPFHSGPGGKLHAKYRERWPKYFDLFEKEIKKLYWKRVGQGKKMFYSSPQEFCEAWYENNCARWYAVKPTETKNEKQLEFESLNA